MSATLDEPSIDCIPMSPKSPKISLTPRAMTPRKAANQPKSPGREPRRDFTLRQPDKWSEGNQKASEQELKMMALQQQLEEEAKGGSSREAGVRRPGSKPNLAKMREAGAAPAAGQVHHQLQNFRLDNEDDEEDSENEGWSDSDWEAEERAAAVATGDPMDGVEVGCPPTRKLRLPQSCCDLSTIELGVCGRSILHVPWTIPVAAKGSQKGRARGKLPTPPWRKHESKDKHGRAGCIL